MLCVSSFRHLGCWGVLQGLGNLADTVWRKRLRRAADWLEWMLHQLLSIATGQFPWLVQSGYRRMVLLDATHLTCRGPLGMVWRLHCAFDLLAGRLTQVKVTDHHTAEDLELFDTQPGDLIISDNVNGYRERLFHVLTAQADLLVRFSANPLPLHDEQGPLIDLLRWLKGRHLSAAGRRGLLTRAPSGLPAAIEALFVRESTPPRPSLFADLVLARCPSSDGGAHMSQIS